MSIYYVRNSNGKYYSTDRKIRYIKLTGKEAFDYLHKSEGSSKTFIRANDENEAEGIFVETDSVNMSQYFAEIEHQKYLNKNKRKSRYKFISIYACEGKGEDGDTVSGEELIADDNVNVEKTAEQNEMIYILKKALTTLNETDSALVTALYLQEKPMSEKEYAEILGVSQQAISKQKLNVLRKLKKYF